jgi:outer membrane protein insertion porin family
MAGISFSVGAERALRFGKAVAVALVISVGATGAVHAQQVVVQGNQRIEADTVRSYLNIRPGVPFDAARQDEAVRALFATGLFRDVRISRDGGRVVVRVVENPVLNRVAFEGNRRVERSVLQREVESQSRGVYTEARVRSDVQRILDLYRRQGRHDVRVEPKVVTLPDNRIDLVFEIAEGERTRIDRIAFVGNTAYGDRRLKDVITTAETNFLSFLNTRDVYDPDRLAVDQELLRRFYLRNGYADFRVISAVADFDQTRNGFTITFTVEEGDRYSFGAIELESNVPGVDAATLRGFVQTSPGATYNAELIDRTIDALATEVARRGFSFAQVRPRGERDPAGRLVNVTYVIEEGPRLYVERINIRGNTRTMDSVIRREFDVAEGDALNRVMVERAERRLNQTQFFRSVRVQREPGSAPDRVVLNVNVDEQPTGEVSLGGGYASNEGFIADVSIAERNFLGRGQFVRAAVGWGESRRNVDISFTEPYFLDRRLSAGVDLFYRRNLATSTQSFNSEVAGAGLRLGVQLNDDLSAQVRYRGYRQTIEVPREYWDCAPVPASRGYPPLAGADSVGRLNCLLNEEASQAIKSSAGRSFVSSVGFTLVYNRLDNPRRPTSGLYADLNVDFAGVGGDVNFVRTIGEARYYYPIMEDVIGMLRVQGGHIAGWGGQGVRLVDSFFRGGDLVRGFAPAGIGPRDISISRLDSLGGTVYVGASAEVTFPIPLLPEELGLRGAVFADAGTVFGVGNLATGQGVTWNRCTGQGIPVGCNYTDDRWNFRTSVGVSLLWQSPMGPLRFDFAQALNKQWYDRTQFFRFSGGTTF